MKAERNCGILFFPWGVHTLVRLYSGTRKSWSTRRQIGKIHRTRKTRDLAMAYQEGPEISGLRSARSGGHGKPKSRGGGTTGTRGIWSCSFLESGSLEISEFLRLGRR